MKTLNVQVRDNGVYHEMFFYDEHNNLSCFSFVDGHTSASEYYRLEFCEPVNLEAAKGYVDKMQKHYDSLPDEKIKLKLVQRLVKR